jgi:tRNA threonylcarbamoyladenosine biosynthesis protein TsaE
MVELVIETASPEETLSLGRALGGRLSAGDVVVLQGELGAGKTCLTKGIALGLGLDDPGVVTSPTFVLMNSYPTRIPLRHYDLYRIEGDQLPSLGFWDLRDSSVSVVEWGDKADPGLFGRHTRIRIEITGESSRRLFLSPTESLNLSSRPPFV